MGCPINHLLSTSSLSLVMVLPAASTIVSYSPYSFFISFLLREKEKEVFFKNKEKFSERVEDNKHNSTDLSYINFENSDKLISSHVEIMNDVFLIELPKNIKKQTLKDNLKTIKYLINKNDIYYVNDIKIKCFIKKIA